MNVFGKVPAYCKVSFFEGRNRSISFDPGIKFTNNLYFCRRYKFAETFLGLVETSQWIAHFFSELQIALPNPKSRRRAHKRHHTKTSYSANLSYNTRPIINKVEQQVHHQDRIERPILEGQFPRVRPYHISQASFFSFDHHWR